MPNPSFCFPNRHYLPYHTLPTRPVNPMSYPFVLSASIFAALVLTAAAAEFPDSGPTVTGSAARLNGKLAAAPQSAPLMVKRAIWAANQLHSKPYRYGGGHKSFHDSAYDCSG